MNSLERLNLYALDLKFLNQPNPREMKLVKVDSEVTQSTFETQDHSSGLAPLFHLFALVIIVSVAESLTNNIFRKTTKRKTISHLKPIPCESCHFFIDNPHLKCAVHPAKALTPLAFDCQDCQPDSIVCPKNKVRSSNHKVDE